ncbi:MAG: PSD1 domain-containing protein [Planctomycetales bacterium]|nr:PSD1 domain-containing protein [Planctomycetales bacterium]
MTTSIWRCLLALAAVTQLAGFSDQSYSNDSAEELTREEIEFFENEIRPILADHCTKCHGRQRQEGELRLDTAEGLLAGGESGSAVEPGDVEGSQLISAVLYRDLEMPPSGQLEKAKIEKLMHWVAAGAKWPSHAQDGGLELRESRGISESDRDYWAFRPLKAQEPPSLGDSPLAEQIQNPIDAFIALELDQHHLQFAAPASKRVLMRRIYFDLIGLPPTPEEAQQFLDDDSEGAYERLVDRLLQDRRYGEKWARHWLDLVRYAESDGYNQDAERPTAYLYRDWVISALNADMPYDEFTAAQLAGDEIAPDDADYLAATGYLRSWIYEYNQRDVRSQWENVLNDITDVTGEVFFGLGMGCARCHDHKFDPILQKDYYRLRASFAAFIPKDDKLYGSAEELDHYRQQLAKWEQATETIRAGLKELEDPVRQRIADTAKNKFPLDVRPVLFKLADERDGHEQQLADFAHRQVLVEWDKLDFSQKLKGDELQRWQALKEQLDQFQSLKPAPLPRLLSAGEVDAVPPHMFIPVSTATEPVLPQSFEVMGGGDLLGQNETASRLERSGKISGRRTRLAQWINSRENVLPHRVIVNRIWQYHFGRGIVENASDFGRLGRPPSHPELLDWLAVWFLENGRSLKSLHRLIVTSTTYTQDSQISHRAMEQALAADQENRLLWRYPSRRLDAEQIRDAMLVAAQSLSGKRSGPSEEHDSYCRSVFTLIKRNKPHPFLGTFDAPDGSSSVALRQVTTTPIQSLLLVNAPWPLELSGIVASQLTDHKSTPRQNIVDAYTRCLQREPTKAEVNQAVRFLRATCKQADRESDEQPANTEQATSQNVDGAEIIAKEEKRRWFRQPNYRIALADFCHVLFNSSEFLYVR